MIFNNNGKQTISKSPKDILDDMMSNIISLNERISKCYTDMANSEIIHYHMNANGTDDEKTQNELSLIKKEIYKYLESYFENVRLFNLSLIKVFDDNDIINKLDGFIISPSVYLGKIHNNFFATDNNAKNISVYIKIMSELEDKLSDGCIDFDEYGKCIIEKLSPTKYYDGDLFKKVLRSHFCKLQTGSYFNPNMTARDILEAAYAIKYIYNYLNNSIEATSISSDMNVSEILKSINIVGLFRHFLCNMMLSFTTNWNDTIDLLEDI